MPSKKTAFVMLLVCLSVLVAAFVISWRIQTYGGQVSVSNVHYTNEHGLNVRAKLFKPNEASSSRPMPGVVFMHGYQSVREMGDSFGIELSKRGFVVLTVDAIGRGNSSVPGTDLSAPDFDHTFGGNASVAYLRSLDYVKQGSIGLVGHSLGAGMLYKVALNDDQIRALVILGAAYTTEATHTNPKNMLMIIGRYDEFRHRMTGTEDIEAEWMDSEASKNAIPVANAQVGQLYGNFDGGTARKVLVPPVVHMQETHNNAITKEVLLWLQQTLHSGESMWKDPNNQTWHIKEWLTLIALIAGFAAVLPFGVLLLGLGFFAPIRQSVPGSYACNRKDFIKFGTINGLLMWLYLPAPLMVFAVHKFVYPLDGVFPLMMVNAIAWWFVLINVIGFFLFKRWIKKQAQSGGPTWADLGIDRHLLGRTAVFAGLLFAFVYLTEHVLEALFIVDYRFIFAFANDLTPYRALMLLWYFPAFLIGFLQLGFFLHGQLRLRQKTSWFRTYVSWTGSNLAVLLIPMLVLILIQYVPLLATLTIPFVGPGGMLALFMINATHVVGVLLLIIPISTWFYMATGRPYVGSILCAAIVTWMFASSQVITPVPI